MSFSLLIIKAFVDSWFEVACKWAVVSGLNGFHQNPTQQTSFHVRANSCIQQSHGLSPSYVFPHGQTFHTTISTMSSTPSELMGWICWRHHLRPVPQPNPHLAATLQREDCLGPRMGTSGQTPGTLG